MTRDADHVRRANAWQWGAIGVGSAAAVLAVGALVLSVTITPGQGTVLGGFGVLVGAGLAFYTGHASRTSRECIERDNAARAERELEQQQRHFDEQQHIDAVERAADRRAAITRDLRGRFTVAAAQLADPSPAIRLAGVYSLIALADDWAEHDRIADRNVCIELLMSYLRAPQLDPAPDADDAEPHLRVRSTIVRETAGRLHRRPDEVGSWDGCGVASFERADLRHVDLSRAVLTGCSFFAASLRHSNLTSSVLDNANFQLADLTHASLLTVECQGARMRGAHLNHATLSGARFTGADLEGATFFGVSAFWTDLKDAQMSRARLSGADLEDALDLEHANLNDIEWDADTKWPRGFKPPPSTPSLF